MHNYQPNQLVQILTVHLAVDGNLTPAEIADGVTGLLTEGGLCAAGCCTDEGPFLLDWSYANVNRIADRNLLTISEEPHEAEAFRDVLEMPDLSAITTASATIQEMADALDNLHHELFDLIMAKEARANLIELLHAIAERHGTITPWPTDPTRISIQTLDCEGECIHTFGSYRIHNTFDLAQIKTDRWPSRTELVKYWEAQGPTPRSGNPWDRSTWRFGRLEPTEWNGCKTLEERLR